MAMERSLQEILERLLAGQQEIREMHADIIAKIEAGQKEILVSFRGSTTCHTETTSCPGEMDATNLEATLEATEAAVERQALFKKEINFDNIGSSEDRSGYRRLVVRRRRGAKKRTEDGVRSREKLSAARMRVIVTPSLPFEEEKFVTAQARTTLLEEPPEERRS
jgi:hypothetical protein